jgi:hypothetical protein
VSILTRSETIQEEGDKACYMRPVNITVIEAYFSFVYPIFRGILSYCGAAREQRGCLTHYPV